MMKIREFKKPITIAVAIALLCVLVVGSMAFFTDRVENQVEFKVSSFEKDGYLLTRSAPAIPFTAGETVDFSIDETNSKTENIKSAVTMSAVWDSPDKASTLWGNANAADNLVIKCGNVTLDYTVDAAGKISFTLPDQELKANKSVERKLQFIIPESLKATGDIDVSFDEVTISQTPTGFSQTYTHDELNKASTLDFTVRIGWAAGTIEPKSIMGFLGGTAGKYSISYEMPLSYQYDAMKNFSSKTAAPWSSYASSVTTLNFKEGMTGIGSYAFADFTKVTSVKLPESTNSVNTYAFDNVSIAELTIPENVNTIESMAFGHINELTKIHFNQGENATLRLPTAGSATGAFYVNPYVPTEITGANITAQKYDWVTDQRMKVGVIDAELSYKDVKIDETVEPDLIVNPEIHDDYQSIKYEIIDGEKFATIDEDTGVVTGVAKGTATVKVTIVDANGKTVTAEAPINVLDPIPVLAKQGTWYTQGKTTITKDQFTLINFVDTYTPVEATVVGKWDASHGKAGTITAYVEDDGSSNGTYKLTVAGNGYGKIYANVDSDSAFSDFTNVTAITGLTSNGAAFLDTSNVTDMRLMFSECHALTDVDVTKFDTSKVKNMSSMFQGCRSIPSLDLRNFDTGNVTDMFSMFRDCHAMTSLDVSSFDTSKVGTNLNGSTSMNFMFMNCYALKNLDVSNFDTSNVTGMESMFNSCVTLTTVDVTNFDTRNVKNMREMFAYCDKLTSVKMDATKFDTSKVETMMGMFSGLENLPELDVTHFKTGNVKNMANMFLRCEKLTSLDVSKFDTRNLETMGAMFSHCKSLTELDVSNFVTTNVSDMSMVFSYCSGLTSLDVTNFDTSRVKEMDYMFEGCEKLTSLDLSNFVTSSVTKTNSMFSYCLDLVTIYATDRFNMDGVTRSESMFFNCFDLVGGAGTAFDNTNALDKTFALVDGGTENPGYFTNNVFLAYKDIYIDEPANPQLDIRSAVFDAADVVKYEIVEGGEYATINATTGVVTGKAKGTVTVQVTLKSSVNGDTITAKASLNVFGGTKLLAVNLAYDTIWVGQYADAKLTVNPTNALYDPKLTTYEINEGKDANGNAVAGTDIISIDSNGKVKGLKKGTAYVTVKVSDGISRMTVSVKAPVTVKDIGVTSASLKYNDVEVNKTVNPQLTINPADHAAVQSTKYEIISGGTYASVNSTTGVVTGKATGTATVRVTIVDANGDIITAEGDVNVKGISITGATLAYNDVEVNKTVNPQLTITPTVNGGYKSISYQVISGGSYASVNSTTGVVTGKAKGTATVRVTIVDNNGNTITAEGDVNVKGISITGATLAYNDVEVNKTVNPQLTITPTVNGGYKSISYQVVSGGTYASVNSTSGVVTGKAKGTATVQVTIVDNNGNTITAKGTVNVTQPVPKVAQAIFCRSDGSLTFIRDSIIYKDGDTFDGKKVTAVYTGFETDEFYVDDNGWGIYCFDVKSVVFRDEIKPIYTDDWFSYFYNCRYFDVRNLNTKNVINMSNMFFRAGFELPVGSSFTIIGMDNWKTGNVEDMSGMFYSMASNNAIGEDIGILGPTMVDIGNLSSWDTRNVIDMRFMFAYAAPYASTFDIGDLSNWDVRKVETMSNMFDFAGYEASEFYIGDISKWEPILVEDMDYMFDHTGFNAPYRLDLSDWSVPNVIYHYRFNEGVKSKVNPPTWVRSLAATTDLLPTPELPDDVTTGNVQTITSMPDVAALIADAELNAPENTSLYGWLVDAGGGDQIVLLEDFESALNSIYEEESEWTVRITALYQTIDESEDSEDTEATEPTEAETEPTEDPTETTAPSEPEVSVPSEEPTDPSETTEPSEPEAMESCTQPSEEPFDACDTTPSEDDVTDVAIVLPEEVMITEE